MNGEAILLRNWERRILVGLMGLLAAGFFAWAGVVWSGKEDLVNRMDQAIILNAADRLEQERYRALVERRLALIEQKQAFVLETLRKQGIVTP